MLRIMTTPQQDLYISGTEFIKSLPRAMALAPLRRCKLTAALLTFCAAVAVKTHSNKCLIIGEIWEAVAVPVEWADARVEWV